MRISRKFMKYGMIENAEMHVTCSFLLNSRNMVA